MNRATILGVGGGIVLGAAAGTFAQAITRQHQTFTRADRDEWQRDFDEHFAREVRIDADEDARVDDLIRRDLREHDAPPGVTVTHTPGSMFVEWKDEPSRVTYGVITGTVGLVALGIGIGVAMEAARPAGDLHRFRGVGGAFALGFPTFVGAYLAANLVSNAVMDIAERGSP